MVVAMPAYQWFCRVTTYKLYMIKGLMRLATSICNAHMHHVLNFVFHFFHFVFPCFELPTYLFSLRQWPNAWGHMMILANFGVRLDVTTWHHAFQLSYMKMEFLIFQAYGHACIS